jgi:uncharacterized membrane protein YgcG
MKNAKGFVTLFLILCITITFSGCKKQQDQKQESNEAKQKFDIKVATNIIETYMGYLTKEDMESAKKLYSEDLLEKHKGVSKTELKVFGYKMDEINEVGKSALFKVRVTKAVPDKPAATLDIYNIKVIKKEDKYLIDEVNSMTEKDAFFEEEGLRVRDKNNIKTNLLLDRSGIPQFAYPKDDNAKINKVTIPKDKFGILNFSYSGERIAITTNGKDSYIAVVKVDETMSVQGGGGGGGGNGGGGGGAEGGGAGGAGGQGAGGSTARARETPVGKEINSIDIINDSKIELLTFSLDEKYVLVQYNKNNKGTNIRVYDTDSGELIPVNFEEEFPLGKVDVKFSSFDKNALNIEVVEKSTTDKSQAQLLGKWQIDLKKYELKKL